MGFFNFSPTEAKKQVGKVSIDYLHKHGCKVCPLNQQTGLKNPQMEPSGSDDPDVYMLGEAPGKIEDREGIPFVGPAGEVLHFRIPEEWYDSMRFNNCVRTRPLAPKGSRAENREPTPLEIECCRPSIIADIEETQPKAIFGFGNIPLNWLIGRTGITSWNGRRIPIQVGDHKCWFFPMIHPSAVLRSRREFGGFEPEYTDEYGSEQEFVFALNMSDALSAIDDLPEPVIHTRDDALSSIEIVTGENGRRDVNRIVSFLKKLHSKKVVGIDIETNGLRPYAKGSKILTIALSHNSKTLAFAVHHKQCQFTERQNDEVLDSFVEFLLTANCRKVVHMLGFELEWFGSLLGREVIRAKPWGCTLTQAYTLDERPGRSKPGCHSLDFLCLQYFGISVKAINPVDVTDLDNQPLEQVLTYNAVDAKYHRLLYLKQRDRIAEEGLKQVYKDLVRRIPTFVLTQLKGIPVNQKTVQKYDRKYKRQLNKIEEKLARLSVVKQFNRSKAARFRPSANDDVKSVLNSYLHADVSSTDESVLKEIDHPFARLMLRWRSINKNHSTYVLPVKKGSGNIHPDGLLHPVITTHKTRTSRTSSEHPNEQNWPKRKNREVREQIDPGPGFKIVSFDYGQIQARNVAMESKDEALIKAFWDRYDIHEDWMERIFKAYPKWVPGRSKALKDKDTVKAFRNRAKNEFVFPSFFGAQSASLSFYLDVPEPICEELHEEFWDMFPDVKHWHENITNFYYENGYVTGLSGVRRRAPISQNKLINAPIQADEALIVCDAMSRLSEIDHDKLQANMEIHDDLTFIWPTKEVDELAETVIDTMLKAPFDWINVPIVIEMAIGDNWLEMEDVGVYASDTWDRTLKHPAK